MSEHGGSTSRRWIAATVWTAVLVVPMTVEAQSLAPAAATPAAAPANAPIDNPMGIPDLHNVLPAATTRSGVSTTLQILVLMTLLTLAPTLMIMTTCFTRIVIVLSLLRQAIGAQQLPPSQVVVALALFMTFVVMGPTWKRVHDEAIKPWLNNEPGMTQEKALDIGTEHVRKFMFDQIERTQGEASIYLFHEHSNREQVAAGVTLHRSDVSTATLIPAFMLNEIKTAFVMGFRVYLPFLVIDMVIASVLVSMGMMMLPPMLVALPFKLLLFVLADGWDLVIGTLMQSFS